MVHWRVLNVYMDNNQFLVLNSFYAGIPTPVQCPFGLEVNAAGREKRSVCSISLLCWGVGERRYFAITMFCFDVGVVSAVEDRVKTGTSAVL